MTITAQYEPTEIETDLSRFRSCDSINAAKEFAFPTAIGTKRRLLVG
jgi:hypothetical protein